MKNKEFRECAQPDCNKVFRKHKTTDKYCSWNCANKAQKEKGSVKRSKPISPIGASRAKLLSEYRPKRDNYMLKNKFCEFEGCKKHSDDLHHKAGRIGKKLTDENNFMAVCRTHHNWIHEHPTEARELGYLI